MFRVSERILANISEHWIFKPPSVLVLKIRYQFDYSQEEQELFFLTSSLLRKYEKLSVVHILFRSVHR